MKQIKYRAYHKENKKYYFFGGPIYNDEYNLLAFNLLNPDEGEGDYCNLSSNMDNFEDPEQYTGLKDKNGKEIYEGDILREPASPVGGADGGYLYKNRVIEWLGAGSGYSLFNPQAASEIIGNIHSNPELLNK